LNAIVLAGAGSAGVTDAKEISPYRAGLLVGGRNLLTQTLEALSGLPGLGQVVLVGPGDLVPDAFKRLITTTIPPDCSLADNLAKGLSVLPEQEQVLILASDLPLLTTAALQDFLSLCAGRQGDIHYPIIRKSTYEAAYPGSNRTYLTVKDGTFTGGNVALLASPDVYRRHQEIIKKVIAWRKHPQRAGRLLGLWFLLGLLFHRRTVAEIEARIAAGLGIRAAAVESRFSEIGYDVDSRADLEWIEFYWGGGLEGTVRKEPGLEEEEV